MPFITFPRTFANLTTALLSYLDDNFTAINTAFSSATGGISSTPGASRVPISDADGYLSGWGRNWVGANITGQGHGTTAYYCLFGQYNPQNSEYLAQQIMPLGGKISKLYAQAPYNNFFGTITITLRKNGSDTALTVTITTQSTSIVTDLTDVVSFVAGDLLDWKVVVTGTQGTSANVAVSALISGV